MPYSASDRSADALSDDHSDEREGDPSRRIWKRRRWPVIVGASVACLTVAVLAVAIFFDSYTIPTSAMTSTIQPGDRVLVRSVDGEDLERGQVILYRSPGIDILAVGRVVGLPGESIESNGHAVLIDGRELTEPYLDGDIKTSPFDGGTISDDSVFVMADNRSDARDSRAFGPVPVDDVRQQVELRWWPLGRLGRF